MSMRFLGALILLCLMAAPVVHSHEPGASSAEVTVAEQRLAASEAAERRARAEYEALLARGMLSPREQQDYLTHLAMLRRAVEADRLHLARLRGAPASTGAVSFPNEKTDGHATRGLEGDLNSSLSEFDQMLLREMEDYEASREAAAAAMGGGMGGSGSAGGSSGGASGAGEGEGEGEGGAEGMQASASGQQGETGQGQGEGQGSEAGEGTMQASTGQPGAGQGTMQQGTGTAGTWVDPDTGRPVGQTQGQTAGTTTTSGQTSGATVSGSGRMPGHGPRGPYTPAPSGSDDDVIARQLREAAENETDPVLKERLWQEYYRYKRGG